MLGAVDKTDIGLQRIKFTELYDADCIIQQSNSGTHIWLGYAKDAMYLNREQVADLIHQLQSWLENGKFDEKGE